MSDAGQSSRLLRAGPPRPAREDDEAAAASLRPIVIQSSAPRSALGTLLQVVALLLLLALFVALSLAILALASLVGLPGQVAGGVGDRLGGAAAGAGRALGEAERAIREAADPARPPTGLAYDTEVSALRVVKVGEPLPEAREHVLTLQEIRRREGAAAPETALYAVVRAELRQPRETRLFGQVVRSDRDARDYVLYKGESLRIGRSYYRVNWVSLEEQAVAFAAYRHPDAITASLKLAYD